MTLLESAASTWKSYKPRVIALVIGLVAGPLLTNFFGYQTTVSTAKAQVRAGIVEQQALYCEARARADVSEPGKLDWNGRTELAKKWTEMPGTKAASTTAYPEVESACADKLAS